MNAPLDSLRAFFHLEDEDEAREMNAELSRYVAYFDEYDFSHLNRAELVSAFTQMGAEVDRRMAIDDLRNEIADSAWDTAEERRLA